MEETIKKLTLEQLSTWHEQGFFEINERKYSVTKLTHQLRIEALSIFAKVETMQLVGDLGYLVDPKYKEIARKIEEKITFDGAKLSTLPNHWEQYPEDFILYGMISLKVICYPFYQIKRVID